MTTTDRTHVIGMHSTVLNTIIYVSIRSPRMSDQYQSGPGQQDRRITATAMRERKKLMIMVPRKRSLRGTIIINDTQRRDIPNRVGNLFRRENELGRVLPLRDMLPRRSTERARNGTPAAARVPDRLGNMCRGDARKEPN